MEQEGREEARYAEPEFQSAHDPAVDVVAPIREMDSRNLTPPSASMFAGQPSVQVEPTSADMERFFGSHSHSRRSNAPFYFGESSLDAIPRSSPGLGPQYSRAAKDVSDPTESTRRTRVSLARSVSSTRAAINTLFTAASPNSQPSSRQASFLDSSLSRPTLPIMQSSQGPALGTHIYTRGLLEGRHHDICLNAFGTTYKLHRLVLDQAPYFASAFSGPWLESSAKEINLHPEETDVKITKEAFELALKRLYGCPDPQEETFHCLGLLPTACWLEMPEMVRDAVDIITRTLQAPNLSPAINMVTSSYYGKAGERILQSATILLKREGSSIPIRCWDNIPSTILRSIIGADDFFIKSEWDRWLLAKKLLNRRLRHAASLQNLHQDSLASHSALLAIRRAGRPYLTLTTLECHAGDNVEQKALREWVELYHHPDIVALHDLLDNGIYYTHLDFEALQSIKSARDSFGVPIMAPSLISDALWAGTELRQIVLKADPHDLQLGLSKLCSDADVNMQSVTQLEQPGEFEPSRKDERYLIPRVDCNISIGANPAPLKASEERKRGRNNNNTKSQGSEATASASADQEPEQQRYSHLPPFRFSVEFPNPSSLDERKHVHSQTVFYAGSYWNVYVQKIRKGKDVKEPQLGVYLRRADDPPAPAYEMRLSKRFRRSVDERIGDLERVMLPSGSQQVESSLEGVLSEPLGDTFNSETIGALPSGVSTTMLGSALDAFGARYPDYFPSEGPPLSSPIRGKPATQLVSHAMETSDDNENLPGMPSPAAVIPSYVDDRSFVKAYFKIFCPSAGGRSLNIWESVPDNFSIRQSWGWRSSSLLGDIAPVRASMGEDDLFPGFGEQYRKLQIITDEEPDVPHPPDTQLRFSVVIGLV